MEPGPSILNMAEAMLQNNDYKSSHSSLKEYADEEDSKQNVKQEDEMKTVEDITTSTTTGNYDDDEMPQSATHSGEKKSEGRCVVIQVPPKRRKLSSPFTPKEIVDGT